MHGADDGQPDHYPTGKAIGAAVHPRIAHYGLGCSELAGGGEKQDEILADYPELEPDNFRAVFEFATRVGRRVAL